MVVRVVAAGWEVVALGEVVAAWGALGTWTEAEAGEEGQVGEVEAAWEVLGKVGAGEGTGEEGVAVVRVGADAEMEGVGGEGAEREAVGGEEAVRVVEDGEGAGWRQES